MPSDDEDAADRRSRRDGRGWGPPSAAIVGCPVPMAETCYRHPDRETARLLLLLRAADLPRLHDPDAGRDALPGVREPADQGGAEPDRDARRLRRVAGDLRPDRDQRGRLPGRDRRRQRAAFSGQRAASSSPTSASSARPWPKASGTGSSPAASSTPASSTSASTCSLLYFLGRLLEPALGTPRFLALYFASLLAGSFGALVARAERPSPSAPPGRSSASPAPPS